MTYKFQILSLSTKNTFILLHAGGVLKNNSLLLTYVLHMVTFSQRVQYERKRVEKADKQDLRQMIKDNINSHKS